MKEQLIKLETAKLAKENEEALEKGLQEGLNL